MAFATGCLCLIVLDKVVLRLINDSIVLQFQNMFQKHLSRHQFGISTFRGCETIRFGIRIFLDLHLTWIMMQVDIKNTFINVS
jgi:hypothetical protein